LFSSIQQTWLFQAEMTDPSSIDCIEPPVPVHISVPLPVLHVQLLLQVPVAPVHVVVQLQVDHDQEMYIHNHKGGVDCHTPLSHQQTISQVSLNPQVCIAHDVISLNFQLGGVA